jgi:hypothetical protein
MQSPTTFTPTPPTGTSGQPFFGQAIASPTKQSAPTSMAMSQAQMASASPQAVMNNAQNAQKAASTPPTEALPTEGLKNESRKIDLLLEINRFLFQEIIQLQAIGRGGPANKQGSESSVQPGGQQSPTGTEKESTQPEGESKGEDSNKKAIGSREYVEYVILIFEVYQKEKKKKGKQIITVIRCMRRLQANFAYLTNLVSRTQQPPQKVIERPPIMEGLPPNIEGNSMSEESMNRIRDMYKQLKELFPPSSTSAPASVPQPSNLPTSKPSGMIDMSQKAISGGRGQAMNPNVLLQQQMARGMAGNMNMNMNMGNFGGPGM